MQTKVLQPWSVVSFTDDFVQGAEDWLDLADANDVILTIDVASYQNSSTTISFETAGAPDDESFQPIAPALSVVTAAASSPTVYRSFRRNSTVPLSRWLRYHLQTMGGSETINLRIRASVCSQRNFSPLELGGCVLWFRSDQDVTTTGSGPIYVSNWDNIAEGADPHTNLSVGTSNPVYSSMGLNGLPIISAGNMYSSTWTTAMPQPCTWVYVVYNGGGYATECLLDDAGSPGLTIESINANPSMSAGGTGFSSLGTWSGWSGAIFEFNGASSNIYINNFSTPQASGTVGAASQSSMSLFALDSYGEQWSGNVAEIIAYSRLLSPTEKGQLRRYLNTRYNLGIT